MQEKDHSLGGTKEKMKEGGVMGFSDAFFKKNYFFSVVLYIMESKIKNLKGATRASEEADSLSHKTILKQGSVDSREQAITTEVQFTENFVGFVLLS